MNADPFWLTTERLGLRRIAETDFEWFSGLFGDPEVTQHVGGPYDGARIVEVFRTRTVDYYDRHPGLGMWLTVERRSGTPVGCHNLNHVQGERFIQVGFFLAKAAWGHGYASEMACALVEYGFTTLRLPRICGMTGLANIGAQRVLEKAGLRRRGERTFPAYAFAGPQAWFERDREDWLRQTDASARA